MKRTIFWIMVAVIGLFGLIQVPPFARGHSNPPVVQEPQGDSPQTRELAARDCFDCHSNDLL